jgi:phosphonate transport system substrate-binding protein
MRKILSVFAALAVMAVIGAAAPAGSAEVELKMVFVPASDKGDEDDYANLIKIIENQTGFKITPIKVTDYNAAVEAMRAGRAQIGWYGGKSYILAAEHAEAEAFAAGIRKGDTDATYFSYFVVRQDSPLRKLEDVRGKTLALNHIGSTSGDLIPQVELSKVNLITTNRAHFRNVFYAGSHDACLLTVLNRHADVCGMSSRNFDSRLADKTFTREQVRIIHRSDPVPPPPLAYSKRLPQAVRDKIKAATLAAHKFGKIGGYGGEMERYVAVDDSDYDLLRAVDKLLRKMKKDAKK